MSKDQDHSSQHSPGNDIQPDATVDLEALNSQEQTDEPSSTNRSSSTPVDDITSIEISDLDQTMDLTPSTPSLESRTIVLEQPNNHTVDLSGDPPVGDGATMLLSPSMPPFQGKVFGEQNNAPPEDGTRILSPYPVPNDQTMDIAESSSGDSRGTAVNPSGVHDGTMLLSDSQQGSQPGSSSVAGKSSYDQTMDLSESASDSKSGSDSKSLVSGVRTGQSVNSSNKANNRSIGDSRQLLQAERANASDAIFNRINQRRISYTIDWDDETADYQINKKNDSKTGKLDLHILGKGGMGLVYLAMQNSVKREVALKVIREDKQTDVFSKQFFYEAEITAQLEHPNITPVYELGRTPKGIFFYSMQYIQGTPWEKKIRENSIDENLEIFDKLCDAIAFAHSKDIIHMDIKPDNVQLGKFGEVYAVDWGVASNLKRPESIRCAGTWQWISPEVARGDKSKIGKGSDIYLLGGILFLIVSGDHPRMPKDPSVKMGQSGLAKAAQTNIIQPTDCKDPMLAVALKALETDPMQRFAKVEYLQQAIYAIRKERANIKSSQELTERSIVLADEAKTQGDYDRFNRSLFGLKDAIELWHKNPDASNELKKVRLAYGQCAFEKGDYDLALQTLDRSETIEDELYVKAEEAQTAVKLRVARFRLLRNAFIVSLLGLSSIIIYYYLDAKKQEGIAKTNEKEAKKQTGIAKTNEEEAKKQEKEAKKQTGIAKTNEEEAKKQEKEANRQAGIAKKNEEEAKKQTGIAKTNLEEARRQKDKAEQQLAKTQLTEITSRLGLARSRINESNPTGAFALISEIQEKVKSKNSTDQSPLLKRLPEPNNWAMNRIAYLANEDLPAVNLNLEQKANYQPEKSAYAIDPKTSGLIVANPEGQIYRVDFNRTDPVKIWEKIDQPEWTGVTAVRRVVPSQDGKRIYLGLDRQEDLVVVVDLETKELLPFDRDFPQVSERVAVSPNAQSIAATQPGYIWFSKNLPNTLGNALPTTKQAIQIQWISDELLLALIKNQGRYHLQLIAPFVGTKDDRPTYVEYTAELADGIVQFGLIDQDLPQIVSSFRAENLKDLKEDQSNLMTSQQARELFPEILKSLNFLFGFGDGNLVQARLKRPEVKPEGRTSSWTLVDPYPLPRKHLHAIQEIIVEKPSVVDQRKNRRLLTRSSAEQAVQIWDLTRGGQGSEANQNLSISHLHSLTGRPLQDETGKNDIAFAGFTKEGEVILINSDYVAHRLDIQEQVERKRIGLEEPFRSDEFLESTAKWLFESDENKRILSVDGHGAVSMYQTDVGQRISLGNTPSILKIKQYQDLQGDAYKGRIELHADNNYFGYWGHTPFAEIKHVAVSQDGKTGISVATIPGERSVYFIARETKALKDSLRYQEVCLWDLANGQFLDRMVYRSEASNQRLSCLDENRFVLGNNQTLTLIGLQNPTPIAKEYSEQAVSFCVSNPGHPYHAFFRTDGAQGTCWIGTIPAKETTDSAPTKWFSAETNRMAFPDGAPVAGCWSNDGTRLYVLDSRGHIRRFQLDLKEGLLSANVGPNAIDELKPTQAIPDLTGALSRSPQQIFMGMAPSDPAVENGPDELFIAWIQLPQKSAEASKQLQEKADAALFAKPIHAVFHQNALPEWKQPENTCPNQTAYQRAIDGILNLTATSDSKRPLEFKHQPLHATCDASGRLLLLQYPSATLFLSLQDPQRPAWFRLETTLKNLQSFDLSPEGKVLATVDEAGLHLFGVNQVDDKHSFELKPMASGLPDDAAVNHFAWDPDYKSNQQNSSMRFAAILKDNSIFYVQDGVSINLTELCMKPSKEGSTADNLQLHNINKSDIKDLWFFKEVLTDVTQASNPVTTLRYLAIQHEFQADEGIKTDPGVDVRKTNRVRFIRLPTSDSTIDTSTDVDQQKASQNCVDLDLGPSDTKIAANPQGGVVVTGDKDGNVVVRLVSPYWGIAIPVFDAQSEADSVIESLSFADDGDTLVISNGNNRVFGLRTKAATQESK
jgi:serine/threonine protein kinase